MNIQMKFTRFTDTRTGIEKGIEKKDNCIGEKKTIYRTRKLGRTYIVFGACMIALVLNGCGATKQTVTELESSVVDETLSLQQTESLKQTSNLLEKEEKTLEEIEEVISIKDDQVATSQKQENESIDAKEQNATNDVEIQGNEQSIDQELSEDTTEIITETSEESTVTVDPNAWVKPTSVPKKTEPVKVKGIYVSGPVAGIEKMDELIQLVDETELNALVIDVKNDEGRVTYKMQSERVLQLEAGVRYIRDMEALVKKCKEKDIYLIARVVAFKDPYLAEKCPEYAVKLKNGGIFRDGKGLAWVNPYNREVWEYLLEISKEAANIGFDEIQFDYIRFSTDLKSDKLDFGEESLTVSKTDIITQFTEYAYEELSKLGVYVSADVYGTVIDNKIDQEIVGQDYAKMAERLDYICPMVYPSHYGNGVYGIAIPDAKPYETVNAAMNAAHMQIEQDKTMNPVENEYAQNRAWLQSFTATWVNGHITYGPEEIRAQIDGAKDAGCEEWILWNAGIKYQKDSFLKETE